MYTFVMYMGFYFYHVLAKHRNAKRGALQCDCCLSPASGKSYTQSCHFCQQRPQDMIQAFESKHEPQISDIHVHMT